MSQAAGGKSRRMSKKKQRALRNRRIAAAVVAALAVALGVVVFRSGMGVGSILMGAAVALMLLLAVGLCLRKSMPGALYVLVGLVCVALVGAGYVSQNYARVNGRFVPRYALVRSLQVQDSYPKHFTGMSGLQTLDMRGSSIDDFQPIRALTGLRELDLRENYAFTEAEHDALAAALPGCDIRWSVPVANAHFDSDQTDVDLTGFPLSVGELKTLFARYPEKRFSYLVPLLDQRYATDVQALDLQGQSVDAQTLGEALSLLPQVREIDLRGVPASAQAIASMWNAWPDIRFHFTCDVPNGQMTTEDTIVTVNGEYEDLLAYLAYTDFLPNLERIDASAVTLTVDQAGEIQADSRADKLLYSVSVFGKRLSSANTELNLDGVSIPSVEDVEYFLARLPNLKKVSMCDCGLSQADMGRLFDAHPDIKFVWWIEFGHYKLRTDATAFTTDLFDNNTYGYTSATFEPLRYCTDLMMLDLGHNEITTLDSFRGLTKLRVLILADNKITDISALEGFMDLEYVELFLNDITDLTPLVNKTKLVDLNIFYNPLYGAYRALESMPWLERLWIGGCRLSSADLEELKRALPKTRINVKGRGSTGQDWRRHPHYYTLKKMYETGEYIPFD